MEEYGVTEKGFNIKRLDVIMEEIHSDLSEAFGFDTRLTKPSFLDSLITTFAYQISDLWETAQDNYYAKYPATSTGVNLDNAVQYGGIRRASDKKTTYTLHCTGEDGTEISDAVVATETNPEIRLESSGDFEITRSAFNRVDIIVATEEVGLYFVTINGDQFSYTSLDGATEGDILSGLAAAIFIDGYTVSVSNGAIHIEDQTLSRSNTLVLSDNLTTSSVTVLAPFLTEEYGKTTLPNGIVTKMVNNISGFDSVINLLPPTYGRSRESDIELRQSYAAKSALRSNTMIESIVGDILNNISDVETASGYENDSDVTNERGLPPHSIEIIVEGGSDTEIAETILRRKAGGIQTYGKIEVMVLGKYGDVIPVRFNRPDYLYTWLKVVLHGNKNEVPANYADLTTESLLDDGIELVAGKNLLTQLLNDGIYSSVAGLTYIDIYTAYGDKAYTPSEADYKQRNIIVSSREKILLDASRIEVTFDADS